MGKEHEDESKLLTATIDKLRNIFGDNWLAELKRLSNKEKEEIVRQSLVDAAEGLGYCVDERKIEEIVNLVVEGSRELTVNKLELSAYERKASLPGGALFWVITFEAFGFQLPQAIEKTKELYEIMGWGQMEIHMDDHGGSVDDLKVGGDKLMGCGFLNVSPKVIKVVQRVLPKLGLLVIDNIDKADHIRRVAQAGAQVIVLTGEHKAKQANYVLNDQVNKTLNAPALYNDEPSFITDLWVANMVSKDGKPLYKVLNELLGGENTFATADELKKFIATMSLATAELLNVDISSQLVYLENKEEEQTD